MVKETENIAPKSIYIGGGTPSILPTDAFLLLDRQIKAVFGDAIEEYTIEVNPGTVDRQKAKIWRKMGINRVSLGMQSASDALLEVLGRSHDFAATCQAVRILREAGFENINLDLMYGLPSQDMQQWRQSLMAACGLQPQHISAYQLKIEEQTNYSRRLKRGEISYFDEDTAADMCEYTREFLSKQGYLQYELSNFAKPGFASVHNQIYWRTGEYLGLGLGAVSYMGGCHISRLRDMAQYRADIDAGRLPIGEVEMLSVQEQISESIFMGLRLTEGIHIAQMNQRYTIDLLRQYQQPIERCVGLGLLEIAQGYLRLTPKGRMLGNEVFMEFI